MRNILILNLKILILNLKTAIIWDKKELYFRVCHNYDKYISERYFSV